MQDLMSKNLQQRQKGLSLPNQIKVNNLVALHLVGYLWLQRKDNRKEKTGFSPDASMTRGNLEDEFYFIFTCYNMAARI